MNPVEDQLPPPPQPHRISTSCDSHPDEHFTGFCPSCLFERLSVLDKSASAAASATAGRKSASSAIRSIFRSSNSSINNVPGDRPSFRTRPGSFLPELRRTKSFSSGRNDAAFGFAAGFEPQRKSCDVRARNSLHSLFHQASSSSRVPIGAGIDQVEGKLTNSNEIVIEFNEEGGEIEEIEEPISNPNPKLSCEERLGDIPISEELKPMKDHLDLDSRNKKAGGSFWSAASVLSKKLRSWTRKKKHSGGRTVEVSKKSNAGRSCRETQSEVADYGYGRRSCDTDPRFSLDVGRMSLDYGRISLDAARFSLDDPRYSFDEPRASWDAGRPSTFPRMPSMLSVVEDSHDSHHIPLEEPRRSVNLNSDEGLPGNAAQTKDYYEDSSSSSRRRKSLDRSSSMRKTAAAVVAEMDEMKPAAVEYPLRDDFSEEKKSKSWRSWNIWGMIVRRGTITNKDDEDDRYSRVNGVERSYSESWQDLGRDPRVGFNRNGFRSNSSVSWRNSYNIGGSMRNGHAKKKSNEFVLERNRSARYSPNDDNGLLRFYLAPTKGSRRGAMAKAKPAAYSHTIARSILRMY